MSSLMVSKIINKEAILCAVEITELGEPVYKQEGIFGDFCQVEGNQGSRTLPCRWRIKTPTSTKKKLK